MLFAVETAKDRDILHAALVMACSYRYIPPEHAEDVEQVAAAVVSCGLPLWRRLLLLLLWCVAVVV